MSQDYNKVWKIVKEARRTFLVKSYVEACNETLPLLLSTDLIKENIKYIEDKLYLNLTNSKSSENENINFETAGQMFTYLNICPPKFFYLLKNLLNSETPKRILLAMTSILKTSQNAQLRSNTKIFMKIMTYFKLNSHKEIEILKNGNENRFSKNLFYSETENIHNVTNHPVH